MQLKSIIFGLSLLASAASLPSQACTGITLRDPSGCPILARTIEWGGSDLNSCYVVVPRGYTQRSYVPGGVKGGLEFKARYGYVGFSVEQEDFVAEGLNEVGLSAGLFYFPRYGNYAPYDSLQASKSLADLQLVPWLLSQFRTVGEALDGLKQVRVTAIDPRASTVHWRIADASGRQVVVEIVEGRVQVFENKIGVLTNSPGFEWQLTNLNNYVNLFSGSAPVQQLDSLTLQPFGAGSGFLGLPGDVTPPSRFVRAAFFQASAPRPATTRAAVLQCFQILNSFDIPVGIEFAGGKVPADIPSATQWTSVTDPVHGAIYFRTMRNSAIRLIDLRTIDFGRVAYRSVLLDESREQPITEIVIK